MNGSYNFLLHLITFGVVTAAFVANFILDRKLRAEPDWGRKLYIGGLMRTFGMFSPYTITLLIITGLINMHNRYSGAPYPWYEETWLVVKLACFLVVMFNVVFIIPKLGMKRAMLIKSVAEKSAPADIDQQMKQCNARVSLLFYVQGILLFMIVFLSAFGTGKHPGQF